MSSAFTLVVALLAVLVGSLILIIPLFGNLSSLNFNTQLNHNNEAEARTLPLDVVEKSKGKDFAGDAAGAKSKLEVNDEFIDPEHHCEFCTRIEYTPGSIGSAAFAYKV